jgi:predicted AAA+ superfamily ATPase
MSPATHPRYLTEHIIRDLKKKMVFIGGPRQCGKTSIAQEILKVQFPGERGRYLNWDNPDHQQQTLRRSWSSDCRLVVFDEIHKYRPWKRWIKGLYDTTKNECNYLVTGSARLDVYRKGGDSLLGRYHYWRLHPFTLDESVEGISRSQAFKRLLSVGGFPEPFLDGSELEANRWRRERFDRVLKDDLRDLEQVQNVQGVTLLTRMLRERAGQLIVLANIEKELQISQKTLKRWIGILENLYVCFVVRAHTRSIGRAIHKPFKVYFYDNSDLPEDSGARFENLVATHLLKRAQFLEDRTGDRYEIRFIRDKEKREVDFAILKNDGLVELIEAKWSDREPSSSLVYYSEKLRPLSALQIVGNLPEPWSRGRLQVVRAEDELARPFGLSWR